MRDHQADRRVGLPTPLALVTEQLWEPSLDEGTVRVTVNPVYDPLWAQAENYWILPYAARAKVLLPLANRHVTSAAATNYRGLRRPAANLWRVGAGMAAYCGVPLSRQRLSVQVHQRHAGAHQNLPLARIASALSIGRLYAALGVRTTANRKATLQLLDESGAPVGYAKLGWNTISDDLVQTESACLKSVGHRPGLMRAPGVLATLDYFGHPMLVTEPLPLGVRGLRGRVSAPSPQEMYALCPVYRIGTPSSTRHIQALVERLTSCATVPLTVEAASRALRLSSRLMEAPPAMPVSVRWHGDLAPWNCAREPSGQLWAWDWESSECDAVAGLDAIHWFFSVRREHTRDISSITVPDLLEDANLYLIAAGANRDVHPYVAGVYILTIVERACSLARKSGGWDSLWVHPSVLKSWLLECERLLDGSAKGHASG